jgi:ABC-2 type transport system permease protein
MKKYIETAKITFKSEIAYKFNVIIGICLSVLRIILAFVLWSALFKETSKIAGFTFNMMITYYILVSFFSKLDKSDSIVWQLSSEIREGQFSKYLVRPVNPLWYFISLSFSKTAFVFFIDAIITALFAVVFYQYISISLNPQVLLCALLISILGLTFLAFLNYFIAILSFKFLDISSFNIIKNTMFEFITGAFIPLALFPIWIQDCMRLFPFYYVYYYPSMLIINGDTKLIPLAFTVLVSWNLFILAVIFFSYKILRRKYEGVGI